ncbi:MULTISPECIES: hypothetical protein [unclassified Sinorhizobium]|uniref:hypothetical protein n=1 Tax=unclassified Sinorhizobium TaxID=2613772 RepID=UPI0024C2F03A|nr:MULTISPECIES: hypothetical protein [unclassified Sinorhizobium]MDK1376144.1 hypothetical protein [Sinorhizobium sp. 6-70]MDK1480319.1 hypothetical protein [Sinorhizobium sp. 6-117]
MSRYFPGIVKVRKKHVIASGIVGSTWDLNRLIREGIIRPPYKNGNCMQSRVYWWADELDEDIDRMRAQEAAE